MKFLCDIEIKDIPQNTFFVQYNLKKMLCYFVGFRNLFIIYLLYGIWIWRTKNVNKSKYSVDLNEREFTYRSNVCDFFYNFINDHNIEVRENV